MIDIGKLNDVKINYNIFPPMPKGKFRLHQMEKQLIAEVRTALNKYYYIEHKG